MKRLIILFFLISLYGQFSYAQDALLLKNPTAGQIISGGDYFTISWESSNVENIKIEYSSDGGVTWMSIINAYPTSASKYAWLVPVKPTLNGKLRISDIYNSSIASHSGSFTISEPQLNIKVDTSAALVVGNPFRIGWESRTVEKVNLYYSTDTGKTYTPIRRGFPALAGSFTWIVPSLTNGAITLKVESADSSGVADTWNTSVVSNKPFAEAKYRGGSFDGHSSLSNKVPRLNLVYPAGNETLASSSVQALKWTSDNIEYLRIEFSADSGTTWSTVNSSYPAYAKKFDWTVPSSLTNKGIIRLSSVEDTTLSTKNTIPFKIPLKSIALVAPSDALYLPQQAIPISWVNNGVDYLSVKYRTGAGAWKTIANSVLANMLTYIWVPPVNLITDSLEFKITATDQSVLDSSKSKLAIRPVDILSAKYKGGAYDGFSQSSNLKAKVQLLSPVAGTKLNGFAGINVTWSAENVEDINLYFSSDSGKSWSVIVEKYSGNARKYNWTVPAITTEQGVLKISSSNDSTIYSKSGIFEISEGFVRLLADSTTHGNANSIFPVTWTQSGVSKLDIAIKLNTGTSWTNIIRNYEAAAGSYLFINKEELSGTYYIKAVSSENPLIKDSLLINFNKRISAGTASKFKGGSYDGHSSRSNISKILVIKPQAGEILVAGTKYLITWSTVNVADSVKIEYTKDGGATWQIISVAVDSKLGSFEWTVPGSATGKTGSISKTGVARVSGGSNECRIRISETGAQDEIVGLSNQTFVISENQTIPAQPVVTSFTPKAGKKGTSVTITGTNFTGATAISFDTTAASSFTVISSTTITAVVGTGASGDVTVTTPSGSGKLAGFSYVPIPTIDASGSTTFITGGSVVLTVSPGSGYTYQWKKDGVDIPAATGVSYTATQSGAYSVSISLNTVTEVSGATTVTANPVPVPVIGSITPSTAVSGTLITITGTNFTDVTGVSFGGVSATSFTKVSATTITAIVGSGASGNVVVTTPSGSGSFSGFTYIYSLPVKNFQISATGESCKNSNNGSVKIAATKVLNYTATITGNKFSQSQPFTSTVEFKDMPDGSYSVCITVDGIADFKQCYDVVITEPKDLGVYVAVNNSAKTSSVTLSMTGGSSFKVELNGIRYTTSKTELTLPLDEGQNVIRVSTDNECQGVVEKRISNSNTVKLYPNPFENILDLDFGNIRSDDALVEIRNFSGKMVYTKALSNISDKITLELQHLEPGVYILKLSLDDSESVYKIIKK
ncbi:MAG TPA: IPT/TIG domain-containing protein [Sphingobacteriaceae bacterium]